MSEYPFVTAASRVFAHQGHPCSRAHLNTSRCPPSTACLHVRSSHGQWCCRAHVNISRNPLMAANVHVPESHGQPCARAHCSKCMCPPRAACEHVDELHGHPCSCAHFSTSKYHKRRSYTSPRPTGTRAPAPTAASPGARPEQRYRHVKEFHGQRRSRAHFSTPGGHPRQPKNISACPTGTPCPWPTPAAQRNGQSPGP